MNIFMLPGVDSTGEASGDVFRSIEIVRGTNFDDWIAGDLGSNRLYGRAGNDTLFGWLGGDDFLYGGAGYDVMIGDEGADYLDRWDGRDLADYETSPEGLIASLADPSINTGHAKGDAYVSIEDIAGSAFDDILYAMTRTTAWMAGPATTSCMAGAGNDGLDGNKGDDILYGEGDWDLLVGGEGRDTAGFHGPITNYRVWISDGVALPVPPASSWWARKSATKGPIVCMRWR